jgi:HEAT repeat protein
LADAQVEVRRGAAFYLLGSFNSNDAAQVKAFSDLLADPDRTVRGIGLSAARQMREEDQAAAVPRLAAMLDAQREDKPANRESVARLLATLKSKAAEATEPLATAATSDPVPTVRGACLVAIAQVADPAEAAPRLAQGLADKESSVRLVAAARLRAMGTASAPASKELAAALADDDSRVRAAAAETLVKIGQPCVADVVGQLKGANLDARKLALYCLAKLGPAAKDAAAEVEKCLADSDGDVKRLAEAALRSIRAGPARPAATPK